MSTLTWSLDQVFPLPQVKVYDFRVKIFSLMFLISLLVHVILIHWDQETLKCICLIVFSLRTLDSKVTNHFIKNINTGSSIWCRKLSQQCSWSEDYLINFELFCRTEHKTKYSLKAISSILVMKFSPLLKNLTLIFNIAWFKL